LGQTTRFVAIDVLSAFVFFSDGGGRSEKSSLLIFRIELGRGLSRVVAAAVVDAMEETTN
jgi:hypothetical protein